MRLLGILTATAVALSGLTVAAHAKTVEFQVGQTRHITAYRANSCGAKPPSFKDVMRRIPKSKLVTYSDGGLSSRDSKDCKKRVPTRAVNGTAIKTGKETKRYQSGTVTLVVK